MKKNSNNLASELNVGAMVHNGNGDLCMVAGMIAPIVKGMGRVYLWNLAKRELEINEQVIHRIPVEKAYRYVKDAWIYGLHFSKEGQHEFDYNEEDVEEFLWEDGDTLPNLQEKGFRAVGYSVGLCEYSREWGFEGLCVEGSGPSDPNGFRYLDEVQTISAMCRLDLTPKVFEDEVAITTYGLGLIRPQYEPVQD